MKKVLIGLAVLVGLVLIAGLFIDTHVTVERSVKIDKPKQEVYAYVSHLENMKDYGVWFQIDPDMEHSSEGVDGRVGYKAGWSSDNDQVGTGMQTITKLVENERIEMDLEFEGQGGGEAYMTTEDAGDGATKLTWGFSTDMPWGQHFMAPIMKKFLGNAYEEGLAKAKEIMEAK